MRDMALSDILSSRGFVGEGAELALGLLCRLRFYGETQTPDGDF